MTWKGWRWDSPSMGIGDAEDDSAIVIATRGLGLSRMLGS